MPQGRPKCVQEGTPQRFRKTVRQNKNAPPLESMMKLAPKWDPKSQDWRFWGDLFDIIPHHFWDCFLIVFQWFWECFLHQIHDLFEYLRVSFWNQLLWLKVFRAHTGAWVLRFGHFVFLWYFHDFLVISRDSFRFIWGSVFGGILARAWINCWSFWRSKESPKYQQKSMRKLTSEKVGSEEVRLR